MGTYGDRGNARVLERRLAWRDLPGEVVEIAAGEPIPSTLDVYVIGGAEDVPQTLAAEGLGASAPAIERALDGGSVMLAVCAGFQLVGTTYVRTDGKAVPGLGLVDADRQACSGPIAISRNSPDVLVGRQISSEAEPSPVPPRAAQDVTLHGPPPAGTGGTAKDGEAGSVVCWRAVKFAAPPKMLPGEAAAPIVVVSAVATGASQRAVINPISPAPATNRARMSPPTLPPGGPSRLAPAPPIRPA